MTTVMVTEIMGMAVGMVMMLMGAVTAVATAVVMAATGIMMKTVYGTRFIHCFPAITKTSFREDGSVRAAASSFF